ncbi:MAG: sugar phosphate isomerase/epimerase [Alphaproteobacteria bacterium]
MGDALALLEGLDVDGVELGSTHVWREDFPDVVRRGWRGPLLCHNYFPPAREDMIINLASTDAGVRRASVRHARECLAFAAEVGASLYTVHPGFLAEPMEKAKAAGDKGFDFRFAAVGAGQDEAFAAMVESLADLVDVARLLGVGLAVETQGSRTTPGVSVAERPADYERLLAEFPEDLLLTFNLAHTVLAAAEHGFSAEDFVARFKHRFAAVELSHNDGFRDQHRPLTGDSFVLPWLKRLGDVPLILEFRDAVQADLAESIALVRQATTTRKDFNKPSPPSSGGRGLGEGGAEAPEMVPPAPPPHPGPLPLEGEREQVAGMPKKRTSTIGWGK